MISDLVPSRMKLFIVSDLALDNSGRTTNQTPKHNRFLGNRELPKFPRHLNAERGASSKVKLTIGRPLTSRSFSLSSSPFLATLHEWINLSLLRTTKQLLIMFFVVRSGIPSRKLILTISYIILIPITPKIRLSNALNQLSAHLR